MSECLRVPGDSEGVSRLRSQLGQIVVICG